MKTKMKKTSLKKSTKKAVGHKHIGVPSNDVDIKPIIAGIKEQRRKFKEHQKAISGYISGIDKILKRLKEL